MSFVIPTRLLKKPEGRGKKAEGWVEMEIQIPPVAPASPRVREPVNFVHWGLDILTP